MIQQFFVGKIKDETGGVATEEFVGFKPKIVDGNSEHEKENGEICCCDNK